MSSVRRILVITDEIYPDAVGGIGKSLFQTCQSWVKSGLAVQVLTRQLKPNLPPDEVIAGISIHRLNAPRRGAPWYYAYLLSIVLGGWHWLSQLADVPDVTVVHNPLYMIPATLSRLGSKMPLVLQLHAPIASEVTISALRGKYGSFGWVVRLVAWQIQKVERWAIRRARHVMLTSRFMQTQFERLHPGCFASGRVTILPLGVASERYHPFPPLTARARLNIGAERPVLISVRRLVGRMGLPALIEAMSAVCSAIPGALLLIAGEGYMRAQLEHQIAAAGLGDHVRLLGFVDEADLPITIAAADLYVLPTEELEGFGLGTVEAMMVGVPVVGTPIGATPDLLEPVEPRLLTRDSSPQAIADAVIYWLQHDVARKAVARRCQEDAVLTYDADRVAARVLEVLESIAKEKRSDAHARH